MNHRKWIRRIILSLSVLTALYCIILPFYIHLAIMRLAEDIGLLIQTGDVEEFDRYFEPDTMIILKNEERTYAECRETILLREGKAGTPLTSYGSYDMSWLESPFTPKQMSIHLSGAGEPELWFHMKYGLFPKIDRIQFDGDLYGTLTELFADRKSLH